MSILSLDHINIIAEATLLERCRSFYVNVIGLIEGFRPPFASRGHWLYAGEHAVVHLTERDTNMPGSGSGFLDHYALACDDGSELLARLDSSSIPYEVMRVPNWNRVQVFLRDPAGVGIEVSFTA